MEYVVPTQVVLKDSSQLSVAELLLTEVLGAGTFGGNHGRIGLTVSTSLMR